MMVIRRRPLGVGRLKEPGMRCEKLSVGTVVVAQVEGGEGMCKK